MAPIKLVHLQRISSWM